MLLDREAPEACELYWLRDQWWNQPRMWEGQQVLGSP
jgi:hypothetical protein